MYRYRGYMIVVCFQHVFPVVVQIAVAVQNTEAAAPQILLVHSWNAIGPTWLQRVRRLRRQLDALAQSPEADQDCGDQLMLLAAIRGAVNGVMGEVLEDHIRFHLTDGVKEQIAPELTEGLIDLVKTYLNHRRTSSRPSSQTALCLSNGGCHGTISRENIQLQLCRLSASSTGGSYKLRTIYTEAFD